MSMIKCPECDGQVSTKAPFCPHCGIPIQGNIKRCPICGGFSVIDASQCPHCGARFAANAVKLPQQPSVKEEELVQPDIVMPEEPLPEVLPAEEPLPEILQADESPVEDVIVFENEPEQEPENELDEVSDMEEIKPDETTLKKQKSVSVTAVVVTVLLFLCIVGGGAYIFYWLSVDQMAKEEEAYTLLEGCTNPLNYEDFISRFPNSDHLDDVRARMNALMQEDEEWLAVENSNDRSRLEAYVNNYPHSPHEQRAQFLIDSLDYMEARSLDTGDAYNRYIARHPEGAYYTEVISAMRDIEVRMEREAAARRQAEALMADSLAAVN
ncbi:MAG: hypothetical protein J5486_01320 [Bacteroidaceae bacterium]|nr:hypothetical protein [Bacteroidaceae bacterium]